MEKIGKTSLHTIEMIPAMYAELCIMGGWLVLNSVPMSCSATI